MRVIFYFHAYEIPRVSEISRAYGAESVPKIEIFYEGEIFRDIPR